MQDLNSPININRKPNGLALAKINDSKVSKMITKNKTRKNIKGPKFELSNNDNNDVDINIDNKIEIKIEEKMEQNNKNKELKKSLDKEIINNKSLVKKIIQLKKEVEEEKNKNENFKINITNLQKKLEIEINKYKELADKIEQDKVLINEIKSKNY